MDITTNSISIPVKIGILSGLLYCVFIFIENQYFYSSPVQFAFVKGIFYFIIVACIFYTGYISKKECGGYITFRDCLRAMLLAIAITELFYLLFNILYIKMIDPRFIEKLKVAYQAFFVKNKMSPEKVDEQMQKFEEAGSINFWSVVQSYGFSIIIDAVFAVVFAAILKKTKPLLENQS